ncbi:LysR substrate-binding domain-containing protein [Nitratireductor soli]|uniref:LysR substrate-binding domain-containing protein n=1 Tax=Nitratireductor soli TaxID=1670619 RepID=UPI001FCCF80A|nr:LysR substrate-binding domain-containing protein [Nitratireductor soli]
MPPMAAVRVFEAAARHENFTRAAEELGMTQAAVSYQIKLLEERLGDRLFERHSRAVALSETGRALAPAIIDSFARMEAAFATARTNTTTTLALSTVPIFASNWLAQRLGTFQVRHPHMAVRLDNTQRRIDFARDPFDVAIRVGDGHWPGLRAHRLMRTEFTPLLSPQLAASIGGVRTAQDLLRLPFIDPEDKRWQMWCEAAGTAYRPPAKRAGMRTGSQTSDARAAMSGQGAAILTPAFFHAELASGMLVQPFDLTATDGNAFWLVYPESRRNIPKISAFRSWILAQIAAEETAP